MRRSVLLAYQWVTGISDLGAGTLLYLAPLLTMQMMGLHPPAATAPYLAYIGAFVTSVGLSCLYGVYLIAQNADASRLETVWLLTAFARSAVAIYLIKSIVVGELETPWVSIALFDAACVLIQCVGLRMGWLRHD